MSFPEWLPGAECWNLTAVFSLSFSKKGLQGLGTRSASQNPLLLVHLGRLRAGPGKAEVLLPEDFSSSCIPSAALPVPGSSGPRLSPWLSRWETKHPVTSGAEGSPWGPESAQGLGEGPAGAKPPRGRSMACACSLRGHWAIWAGIPPCPVQNSPRGTHPTFTRLIPVVFLQENPPFPCIWVLRGRWLVLKQKSAKAQGPAEFPSRCGHPRAGGPEEAPEGAPPGGGERSLGVPRGL